MTKIDPHSFLADFLQEAAELVDTIEGALLRLDEASEEARGELVEQVLRELHTLKGNSGMMGLVELQERVHQLEDAVAELDLDEPEVDPLLPALDEARELLESTGAVHAATAAARKEETDKAEGLGERLSDTVRVSFSDLDSLVDRLMEVVVFRNRLRDAVVTGQGETQNAENRQAWSRVSHAETALAKTLEHLRTEVMALRMVPLAGVLERLRRIVHDESGRSGKQVGLDLAGGSTPVDKALLELASEALGHLVRNAVIHGVETPEVREGKGKPPQGRIEVAARVQSEELVIRVQDDGAGIDLETLRERARDQGTMPDGPRELLDVVFLPGVSSQEATDLGAGRGMGLAAVQAAVKRQGGHIEVASEKGRGTRFDLHLPLVVSITGALMLGVDGEEYALPVAAVVETTALSAEQRHEIHGATVLRWRGISLPLLDLGAHFGTSPEPRRDGHVVVIEVGDRLRGLVVDELLGLREVVVKSLDTEFVGNPTGILGSTVLGDGRAVLILDAPSLMETSLGREKSA